MRYAKVAGATALVLLSACAGMRGGSGSDDVSMNVSGSRATRPSSGRARRRGARRAGGFSRGTAAVRAEVRFVRLARAGLAVDVYDTGDKVLNIVSGVFDVPFTRVYAGTHVLNGFGELIGTPGYEDVERLAAVGAVIMRGGG